MFPNSEQAMALNYHMFRQVKDGWKIRVRVVRLWHQHVFNKPAEKNTMDMVLMDEENLSFQGLKGS